MELTADLFPGFVALPQREKSRWAKALDAWNEYKAASSEHGGVVPVTLAAELGGVSQQRIHQLMHTGQLVRVDFGSHVCVGENSFVEWAKSERKGGRPLKLPVTVREQWKTAQKSAKEICK